MSVTANNCAVDRAVSRHPRGRVGAFKPGSRLIMHCKTLLAGFVALFSIGEATSQTPDLYDETVLRTFELSFSQGNYWNQLLNNFQSKTEMAADLTVDGVVYPGVGVRLKGNSSFGGTGSSLKKSFNITVDFTDPDLSLLGYESLNLNNCFLDPTFVREVLTYNVMRQYMPAPKANWIKLVINGENWGVYVNVQQVNKDFMDEWFEDDDGNRYKGEGSGGGPSQFTPFHYRGTSPANYQSSYQLKSENSANPWLDLIALCDALNNSPSGQLQTRLPPVFAVDRAIWYMALNNLFVNLDSYIGSGHNFYALQDLVHDRLSIVTWDCNESFGVFNQGISGPLERLDPLYRLTSTSRPMIRSMLGESRWQQRYFAHMRTAITDYWDWNVLEPMVTTYQDLIRAEVIADNKKLYTTAQFTQNVTQNVTLGRRPVPGLRPFVNSRRSYLLGRPQLQAVPPTISNTNHAPAAPTDAETVWINATVPGIEVAEVNLHHRVFGAFTRTQMFDDGQHQDGAAGDGVYGQSIAPLTGGGEVSYFVTASSYGPAMSVDPKYGAETPHDYRVTGTTGTGTSLVFNELMAKNDSTVVDEFGEYDDWFELYNRTSASIAATGMFVTDTLSNPTKWAIPDGVTLAPGEFLLVWADEDGSQGPLHANFKLAASGEELHLFDTDGVTLLDSVTFGPQVADISTGRLDDGAALWITHLDPSPETTNGLSGCGSRRYSALDSTWLPDSLAMRSSPQIGQTSWVDFTGGSPNAVAGCLLSVNPGYTPMPFGTAVLLLTPPIPALGTGTTSGSGTLSWSLPIPANPAIVGVELYLQAFSIQGTGLTGSNAVWMALCP